jgi:hypothetical protein
MTDVPEKAELLARLARLVAADRRREELAERLVNACRLLLGVEGAAITMENTTMQRITLCASDDVAARLEDLQEVYGVGPSHEAFDTGKAVITTLDPDGARRWPEFVTAAFDAVGVVIVHAMPMRPTRDVIGVLSLYSRPNPARIDEIDGAQFLADTVGAALLSEPPHSAQLNDTGPWAARAAIHQATGMVVAQLQLSASDALAMLRAHAFAHDTTLADIADQVVSRRLDFGSASSETL